MAWWYMSGCGGGRRCGKKVCDASQTWSSEVDLDGELQPIRTGYRHSAPQPTGKRRARRPTDNTTQLLPPPRLLPYTVTLGGVVWIHSLKIVIDHGLGRTMRWICKSLFLCPAADRLHTHSKFPRHRLSKHISSSTLCSAVPTHILQLSLAGRILGARIAAS